MLIRPDKVKTYRDLSRQFNACGDTGYRCTSYPQAELNLLPKTHKTPIMQHRDLSHRRAVNFLMGFRLICQYTPELGDPFYKQTQAVLHQHLAKLEVSTAKQYEQINTAFKEFYTYLVILLENEGIPDAKQAIYVAADCANWKNNHRAHRTDSVIKSFADAASERYTSTQVDIHCRIPGMDAALGDIKDSNMQRVYESVYFEPTTTDKQPSPWLADCWPWFSAFLKQSVFDAKGIRADYQIGMPPTLSMLPGFRGYAEHQFYLFDQNETRMHTRRCRRVTNLIPTDANLSDSEKTTLGYKALVDLIEETLKTITNEHPTTILPVPILIQTPASGDAKLDQLHYETIDMAATYYHDQQTRWETLRIKPLLINANRSVDSQQRQLAQHTHHSEGSQAITWQQVNARCLEQHHELVTAYLVYHFGDKVLSHITDLLPFAEHGGWNDEKTQIISARLASDPHYKALYAELRDNMTELFGALEAITEAYQAIDSDHQRYNINLHIMSLESMLVTAMGGVTLLHESQADSGSVMLMHADSVFEFYYTSSHNPEQRQYPPLCSTTDEQTISYGHFNRLLAQKVESEHHARFRCIARLGVMGNDALSMCLSPDVMALIKQREQLRYLDCYYRRVIALQDDGSFNKNFCPTASQAFNAWFAFILADIERITDVKDFHQRQNVKRALKQLSTMNLSTADEETIRDAITNAQQKSRDELTQTIKTLRETLTPQSTSAAQEHIRALGQELTDQATLAVVTQRPLTPQLTAWIEKLSAFGFADADSQRVGNGLLFYAKPTERGFLRRLNETANLRFTRGFFELSQANSWWDTLLSPVYHVSRILQNYMLRSYINTQCQTKPQVESTSTAISPVDASDDIYQAALATAHYGRLFRHHDDEDHDITTTRGYQP